MDRLVRRSHLSATGFAPDPNMKGEENNSGNANMNQKRKGITNLATYETHLPIQ